MNQRLLTNKEVEEFSHYGETVIAEDNWSLEGICQAQDVKTSKKLVEWLENYVFYVDTKGYIALKPNATKNWQTLVEEVKDARVVID